jgi:membrane-bound lytic murein transglycosylase
MNNSIKSVVVILIIILFYSSCKTIDIGSATTKEEINNIISDWHNNAKNANFNDYFNRLSSDGFYIGTDQKENWTKKEFQIFSKPYFDKKNTWDFKTIKRNIFFSKDNNTAWFNELLDTWMGTCRGSGILEFENGEWKIKQYVLSITIPNSQIKKVITLKNESNSDK